MVENEEYSDEIGQEDLTSHLIKEVSMNLTQASVYFGQGKVGNAQNCLISIRNRISPALTKEQKAELEKIALATYQHLQNYKQIGFERKDEKGIIKARESFKTYNDLIMSHLKGLGWLKYLEE